MFERKKDRVAIDLADVPFVEHLPLVFISLYNGILEKRMRHFLRSKNPMVVTSVDDIVNEYYVHVGSETFHPKDQALLFQIPHEMVVGYGHHVYRDLLHLTKDGSSSINNEPLRRFLANQDLYTPLLMDHVVINGNPLLKMIFCQKDYAFVLKGKPNVDQGPVNVHIGKIVNGDLKGLLINGYKDSHLFDGPINAYAMEQGTLPWR